jgi:hypothetical protein
VLGKVIATRDASSIEHPVSARHDERSEWRPQDFVWPCRERRGSMGAKLSRASSSPSLSCCLCFWYAPAHSARRFPRVALFPRSRLVSSSRQAFRPNRLLPSIQLGTLCKLQTSWRRSSEHEHVEHVHAMHLNSPPAQFSHAGPPGPPVRGRPPCVAAHAGPWWSRTLMLAPCALRTT